MFCVNCGKEISKNESFCPYCGMKIEHRKLVEDASQKRNSEIANDVVADESSEKSRKTLLVVIIIAAIVVAGAIVVFAVMSGSKDAKETAEPGDTTPPIITVKKYSIDEGTDFNIADFVSIDDDVDGPIDSKEFSIKGKVDTSVPGKYDLTVSASDSAGNEAAENFTVEVIQHQGNKTAFIKKIAGLWLNGCQSAADAKTTAQNTGITDVSMTEFIQSGDQCIMTTTGDIKGEFDGDTVPEVNGGVINFSYVSPDLCTAEGTVNGMKISFDLGSPTDQVIMYTCGEYFTHCAYTGFSSESEMDRYLYDE